MSDIFDQMAERWPSPVVARPKLGIFSGGAMSPKSAANLDSLGLGCPERVVINGKVCYPTAALVSYLRARSKRQIKE